MKNILFLLPVFIWWQACSQSSGPDAGSKQPQSILSDSSAIALGDSPDKAYRLFKFTRQVGTQTATDLKLLRLKDLKETLIGTILTDPPPILIDSAMERMRQVNEKPKFYWSKGSEYLITENSVPDSIYERELLIFDLQNFEMAQRKPGQLLNFDPLNDMVFMYRFTRTRQTITFFDAKTPNVMHDRDITAAPTGKSPVVILSPTKKEAKVKAYMQGGVPVNIAFSY